MTRALSFHMQIPKPFWSNAVLTTCYLVNRMLSIVLGSLDRHRVLYHGQPLFSLPHRVFGCTCYVHALDLGRDNLDPHAIKCVFLGYSRFQKDCRCYFPTHCCQFVCSDITL